MSFSKSLISKVSNNYTWRIQSKIKNNILHSAAKYVAEFDAQNFFDIFLHFKMESIIVYNVHS